MNMFWIYLDRFMNTIVCPPPPPQAKIPSSATTLTCCAGHRALPWEAPILSYFGPWETHVYLSMAYGKENPWPLLALSICSHHSSFSNISLSLSLSLSLVGDLVLLLVVLQGLQALIGCYHLSLYTRRFLVL